jgi:hypothetical protein
MKNMKSPSRRSALKRFLSGPLALVQAQLNMVFRTSRQPADATSDYDHKFKAVKILRILNTLQMWQASASDGFASVEVNLVRDQRTVGTELPE